MPDVLSIQDDISREIVNSLRLKLGRGRRRYETSAEAYDLYLRARALPKPGDNRNQNVELYLAAIAKDPTLAPAYAGLASAYAFRSGVPEFDGPGELAKMRAASEKAVQLDPLLAEAHAALGVAYARDAHWEQSEQSFRHALNIDPNNSESHGVFAMYLLLPLGRIEEAVRQMRLAEKTDPLSPQVQSGLAYVLLSAGRYGEAASHCDRTADRAPCLGRARLGQGRFGEAVGILAAAVTRGVPQGDPTRGYLGHAYARAGHREEAEQIAEAAAPFAFHQALVFAGLGDKDRTFEALDRMTPLGPARIGRALTFPEFALLRGDPRVKALRKRAGLPE